MTTTEHDGGAAANGNLEQEQATGTKRSIDESSAPDAKRAKKTDEKQQTTIEETLNGGCVHHNSSTSIRAPLLTAAQCWSQARGPSQAYSRNGEWQ
jgi:hypothetical protein